MADVENAAGVRFILKYLFVIIIIIIIIFLISKFNLYEIVLAPEDCDIPSGFECVSFSAHKDGLNLILQNTHDYAIRVSKVNFKNCVFSGRTEMEPAIIRSFHLKNCVIEGKIKDSLIIDYYTPDNKLHSINGTLLVKVR